MYNDLYVYAGRRIIVSSDTILDGQNNFVLFSIDDGLIEVQDGVTLTLKNIKLKDFSPSHVVLDGSGQIFFDSNTTVHLGQTDSDIASNMLAMTYSFTYVGMNNEIKGNNLDLWLDTQDIVLQPHAALELSDITLHNLSGKDAIYLDKTATLTLNNTVFDCAQNYNFEYGTLVINNDVTVKGDNFIFAYQSDEPLTIMSESGILLDSGLTLSYDSLTGWTDGIAFTDPSSYLALNGATLHTTTTGLNSYGSMFVQGRGALEAEMLVSPETGAIVSGGILLGTGNAHFDFNVEIEPSSVLDLSVVRFTMPMLIARHLILLLVIPLQYSWKLLQHLSCRRH